jgi:hypothetical protein
MLVRLVLILKGRGVKALESYPEYGSRWKEVNLGLGWMLILDMLEYADESTVEEQEQYLSSLDFSRLEVTFDLPASDFESPASQGDICSGIFSSAANLRRLTFLLSKISLAGLTSLTLYAFEHEYITILDKCPNLQELTLSWCPNWQNPT